eukprot:PhF_6_TR31733/c0_g1_i2/m.46707
MPQPLNEIRVTRQRPIRVYVTYIMHCFEGTLPDTPGIPHDEVIIRGTGHAIPQCITIAEIIKKRIPDLYQVTTLDSQEMSGVQPTYEGNVVRSFPKPVPIIFIRLSKRELETNAVGFQPPTKPVEQPARTFDVHIVTFGNTPQPRVFDDDDVYVTKQGLHTLRYLKSTDPLEGTCIDAIVYCVSTQEDTEAARDMLYTKMQTAPADFPCLVILDTKSITPDIKKFWRTVPPCGGVATSNSVPKVAPYYVDNVLYGLEWLGRVLAPPVRIEVVETARRQSNNPFPPSASESGKKGVYRGRGLYRYFVEL